MPKRIQLSRKKGWRKPEGCIVVARPTKLGNPFRIGHPAWKFGGQIAKDRADAVRLYAEWAKRPQRDFVIWRNRVRALLAGHDLACWCPLDQPCHADVLLEIANSPVESEARS